MKTTLIRYLKLITGMAVLAGVFSFFASGFTPPGVCGEVLRHNQQNDIDASPLWYMEVENMSEYENGVRELRERAKENRF